MEGEKELILKRILICLGKDFLGEPKCIAKSGLGIFLGKKLKWKDKTWFRYLLGSIILAK